MKSLDITLSMADDNCLLEYAQKPVCVKEVWSTLKKERPAAIWKKIIAADILEIHEEDTCWDWITYLCKIYNCKINKI